MVAQRNLWTCPNCKKLVRDYPALSRKDNTTEICSECGTKEAMDEYEAQNPAKV